MSHSINAVFLPGIVFFFSALSLRAAREQWFNIGFWGYVGGLWVTPMLACLVLAVDDFLGNSQLMLHLAALSPITFFPQLIVYVSPDLMSEGSQLINLSSTIQTGIIASILLVIVLTFTLFRSNRT